MYSYAMRERFNAGQLALLLNIRSFARAMASAKTNRVQLKFAQVRLSYRVDYLNVRSHYISSTAGTNCSPSSYSPRYSPDVSCLYLQRVTLFALDFASPERLEKVLRRLQMKSGSSSQNANDSVERVGSEKGREEEKSVSVVDLLNIVLSAYGSAIHEFRVGFSRPHPPDPVFRSLSVSTVSPSIWHELAHSLAVPPNSFLSFIACNTCMCTHAQ